MTKIMTAFNNFARAQIDHDMIGRFDLPLYQTACDKVLNFETNFKGNAMFRAGLLDMVGSFQDCVFHEFLFRNDQNYLMVFYENKIRFLTYAADGLFGWVLNGGTELEVTTTYTLEQCRKLQFTQNGDVTIITHNDHEPADLTRIAADDFTLAAHPITPANLFEDPDDPGVFEYPAACRFYKGRLYFGNTRLETTTIWASEAGDYEEFDFDVTITAKTPLKFTIAEITQPIEWIFGGENSLILGCAEGLVTVNGGGVGVAIKAETVEADLTATDGSNNQIPLTKDGLIFYQGKNSRNVYYFSFDLLSESFSAEDANFISYDITKSDIRKLRRKKDRNDLIYSTRGDGAWLSLNFESKEKIIGWHAHTSPHGKVKDIAVISDNDGNPQLFLLVDRDGTFYIEAQADKVEFSKRSDFFSGALKENELADDEAYARKVAQELTECVYLDNALTLNNLQTANEITYDDGAGTITAASSIFTSGDVGKDISYKTETGYESGRFKITGYTSGTVVDVDVLQEPSQPTYEDWYLSFNAISGLGQYIGKKIGLVTDGGFLKEELVTGATLQLDSEILSVVVGYVYRGEIKSLNLGFQIQGENTQVTAKNITRSAIRCVASAGGKFGATPYRMEPIQKLSQSDFNYLPPLPIDGTAFVNYSDVHEKDKFFYIVQDEPLPFNATCVFVDANYSGTR